MDIAQALAGKVSKRRVDEAAAWAVDSPGNLTALLSLTESTDTRTSVNALWALTHLPKSGTALLQPHQYYFIDRLLVETHAGKKRLLLSLLHRQEYSKETIRTDFLDYCLSKINSECEPYAVRAYGIYCAFKMCRYYPELVAELSAHLDMLATQSLSPGLHSALATTRRHIRGLNRSRRPSS